MYSQINTMTQLIYHDLLLFKRKLVSKLIDSTIDLAATVLIFSFFMPQFGLKADYGPFILVGAIASFGLFQIIGQVCTLISDIQGDNVISNYLTLPIRSWLLFCTIAISWALQTLILTLFLFPIGKLLLYNQFNFANTSLLKLIPMILATNLFFGFFALWLVSILKTIDNIGALWVRVLSPMYMFGCYFYSWYSVLKFSPTIAYISLINPLAYIFEGMRAAILGQTGYLPFLISFFATCLFTLLCLWDGIRRMKRRMDCI